MRTTLQPSDVQGSKAGAVGHVEPITRNLQEK
jgi:hypothetical protein